MTLQQRIQTWLGITRLYDRIGFLDNKLMNAQRSLDAARSHAIVANRGMTRLIAKLDPEYRRDEMSKEKRAESDAIGDQVMARLLAEHKASNPTESQ